MFTTLGNYPQRRTFLASKVKNEALRAQLNDDFRTSEYTPSKRWCVIDTGVCELFETRKEAVVFCKIREVEIQENETMRQKGLQ